MTSDEVPSGRTTSDPLGKRALFSPPVTADVGRPTEAASTSEGVRALYSAKPASGGWTVRHECSECGSRSSLSLVEAAVKIASFSLWIPGIRYGRWLRCPACERRTWCRIHWIDGGLIQRARRDSNPQPSDP